jgi:hypothetical protein
MSTARLLLLLLLMIGVAGGVSGCGLFVPNMQNFGGDQDNEEADENTIMNHIKCEIHAGVQTALYDPRFFPFDPTRGDKSVDWLRGWGAKVTYVLTVDEKSQLNPGLSWKNPLGPTGTFQSISGGVQTSAEARRAETGAVTYSFADLLKEAPITSCADQNGFLIHSNLRIAEFISNKIFITRVPGTVPKNPVSVDSSKPQVLNAFSDEITFTVMYGGSITPSWTFVRLSVNPTSPLFGVNRSKIQYVTITLAPLASPSSPTTAAIIAPEGQLIDNANLTGHAVASALLNITPSLFNITPSLFTIP